METRPLEMPRGRLRTVPTAVEVYGSRDQDSTACVTELAVVHGEHLPIIFLNALLTPLL